MTAFGFEREKLDQTQSRLMDEWIAIIQHGNNWKAHTRSHMAVTSEN